MIRNGLPSIISGAVYNCFVFCITGLPFGLHFIYLAGSVGVFIFEESFSRGKVSRKKLLRIFLVFSVLFFFFCMSGGDTKQIAEYYFRCAP